MVYQCIGIFMSELVLQASPVHLKLMTSTIVLTPKPLPCNMLIFLKHSWILAWSNICSVHIYVYIHVFIHLHVWIHASMCLYTHTYRPQIYTASNQTASRMTCLDVVVEGRAIHLVMPYMDTDLKKVIEVQKTWCWNAWKWQHVWNVIFLVSGYRFRNAMAAAQPR